MSKRLVDVHPAVYVNCSHVPREEEWGSVSLSWFEKLLVSFEESPDRVVDWTLGSIIVGSVGLGFILGLLTHIWMVS